MRTLHSFFLPKKILKKHDGLHVTFDLRPLLPNPSCIFFPLLALQSVPFPETQISRPEASPRRLCGITTSPHLPLEQISITATRARLSEKLKLGF